jgi:NAD(P)-dependent dehydrogenase (short-subunit alcohol dehydrogenase family)
VPAALSGASVVITGASSGIGRESSLRFARRGARLALAGRSPERLDATAADCRRLGADVVAEVTDVADAAAVESLAARAEAEHGRIDVWVNNAAVMTYGRFTDVPPEAFRRVIETNLMGQVHGSRAALARFQVQEAGVLINVASLWGRIVTPLVSPYIVSKTAVRALSECLRLEVADAPDIHVVTLMPQAVDTPIFQNAGNYTGRRVRPVPPLSSPGAVADEIVARAQRPRAEVTYGSAARSLSVLSAAVPFLYRRIIPASFMRGTFTDERVSPTDGNLFEPVGAGADAQGTWRSTRPAALAAGFGGALIGVATGLAGRTSALLREL